MVDVEQTWALARGAQWNIRGQWVSDDLYQKDFSIALEDKVSQYLPIRNRLDWHGNHHLLSIELDYLQRLTNGNSEDGYHNTNEAEASELQKAATLELWVRPIELGSRVFFTTGLSSSYYSPLFGSSNLGEIGEWTAYNQTRVQYLDQIGPIQLDVGLTNHVASVTRSGFSESGETESQTQFYPMAMTTIQTRLARSYNRWMHIVRPYMRSFNSLRRQAGPIQALPDHWLGIETFQQAEWGISQTWRPLNSSLKKRIELDIKQPLSLGGERTGLMPTQVRLSLRGMAGYLPGLQAVSTGRNWSPAQLIRGHHFPGLPHNCFGCLDNMVE